jgi:hypothetical protein
MTPCLSEGEDFFTFLSNFDLFSRIKKHKIPKILAQSKYYLSKNNHFVVVMGYVLYN